jgi:hypothetical protein
MATCDYNPDSAHHCHLTSLHNFAACNDKPAALTQADPVSRDICAPAMFGLPACAPATPINLI